MLEEFFQQGDLERAQGLPVSPMMDRHATSLSLSQINFTEFIVAPLFHQARARVATCCEAGHLCTGGEQDCGMAMPWPVLLICG